MSEAAKVGIAEGNEQVAVRAERPQLQLVKKVVVDRSRDALLTDFGKTTLEDRYLLAEIGRASCRERVCNDV